MGKIKISAAEPGYREDLIAQRKADNTVEAYTSSVRKFREIVGDRMVHSIERKHITKFFVKRAETRIESSLDMDRKALASFFDWARLSKYTPRDWDPLHKFPPFKPAGRMRLRVPVGRFPQLLQAVDHPRDKMIIALGLYLLPRASEIRPVTVSDALEALETGLLPMWIKKKKEPERKPVTSELDEHLRQYMTWYTELHGTPQRSWYLIAPRVPAGFERDPNGLFSKRRRFQDRLDPTCYVTGHSIEHVVQNALIECGFPVRNERGKSNYEGMHTLRRSGGRALYDSGVDIRIIMSMLGHTRQGQTEDYIGVEPDKVKRDELLRGNPMYHALAERGSHGAGAGNPANLRQLQAQ